MNDKSRVIQKRLITGLLSLAFMMSLVLTPASAAGFDGATFAAPILQNVERVEKPTWRKWNLCSASIPENPRSC